MLANANPGYMIKNDLTCFHQYRIVTRDTTRIHNVLQTLTIMSLEVERVGPAPGTRLHSDSFLCVWLRISCN